MYHQQQGNNKCGNVLNIYCRFGRSPKGKLIFCVFFILNPVKFNRRGGANKHRGGGNISLKLIDGRARLFESLEYQVRPEEPQTEDASYEVKHVSHNECST